MSDRRALARINELVRRGDLAAATVEGEAVVQACPDDPALLSLVGTINCRAGNLPGGAALLQRALTLAPEQLATRIDLANALAMMGDAVGAEAMCAGDAPELLRLRGYFLQAQARFDEAIGCYEQIVATDPSDWEIWNNLGNSRRADGDLAGALEALDQARRLRPDMAPIQLNYAMTLAASGRLEESIGPYAQALRLDPRNARTALDLGKLLCHLGRYAEALQPLRHAAALAPNEVDVHIELGRTYAGLARPDEAEAAYRTALRLRPNQALAFLELGIVFERASRMERLEPLLLDAKAQGVPEADLAYLHALWLGDQGRIEEALVAARHAKDVEPERRARLIGQLADRAGDPSAAFEAFSESNAIAAKAPAATVADAKGCRDRVRDLTTLITRDWYASWAPAPPAERTSPVFLVGFPRSGTTLLDTILMGHAGIAVLEEERILQRVEESLGEFERLPGLDPAEISRLRNQYFEELDRLLPDAQGRLVIDKLPLNLLRLPLIHRLFPDARIIFAQRHPCDVVLSCFMQTFVINDAMANFLDLEDGAAFYDLVLTLWKKCCDVLPLTVHTVRYEDVVEDLEGEARRSLEYLGLPWDEGVLDHARTARNRGMIPTPSYSQVTKPLYREGRGRWNRYRAELTPVLPILAPWARSLGYGDILGLER